MTRVEMSIGDRLAANGYTKLVPELFDKQVELMRDTCDFSRLRVLEVGARDGRHSVAALELGAFEVIAVDGRREEFGKDSRICYVQANVEDPTSFDYDPKSMDIVMAYGLLYHMRDPIEVLWRLLTVARSWVFISTHCVAGWEARDTCAGYYGQRRAEGNSDIDALQAGTSFWLEEVELHRAIRAVGWEVARKHDYEISGLPAVWMACRPHSAEDK